MSATCTAVCSWGAVPLTDCSESVVGGGKGMSAVLSPSLDGGIGIAVSAGGGMGMGPCCGPGPIGMGEAGGGMGVPVSPGMGIAPGWFVRV